MRDPVAEVLAERAALETGAAGGIIVSIFLHGAITAFAVYAALHHPTSEPVNVLMIKLAPMAPANAVPGQPAAPKAPPAPKIVEPKPVVETAVKPAATPVKPLKNTAPPSAFGKSPKKAGEVAAAAPPPSAAAPGVSTGISDVPVGSAGVTGIDGDFPYTLYIENMKRLIGTRWFRPQSASGSGVTIYFEIQRDGSIKTTKQESSSGNPAADRAALRAVLESSPLPPLPFGYNGTFLGVHLTFK